MDPGVGLERVVEQVTQTFSFLVDKAVNILKIKRT